MQRRGDAVDEPIDKALEDLKSAPLDLRIDQLEPRVWARIADARDARGASAFLMPVRAGAVAAAVVFGVAVGGLGASAARAERAEVSVFSVDARLAPSTLLEGL
jgi:hypothetical protein